MLDNDVKEYFKNEDTEQKDFEWIEYDLKDLGLPSVEQILNGVKKIESKVGLHSWRGKTRPQHYKGFGLSYNPNFLDKPIKTAFSSGLASCKRSAFVMVVISISSVFFGNRSSFLNKLGRYLPIILVFFCGTFFFLNSSGRNFRSSTSDVLCGTSIVFELILT